MAAGTKTIAFSGNGDIDALLDDYLSKSGTPTIWNTGNLTFSFPDSASFYDYSGTGSSEPSQNFQAIGAGQLQSDISRALERYAAVANLTFTSETETASAHADLRFAIADLSGGGDGYFPGDGAKKNGDAWFDSATDWEHPTSLQEDFNFRSVMHEVSHTLGLSHPKGSIDLSHDGWDYTIMSYNSYPNAPVNLTGDSPTTPMLDDVAAIQYAYGANFNTNVGDTVYSWSQNSGQMFINGRPEPNDTSGTSSGKIYMTLWDGGGNDTYDFSNYTTNVIADLRPGEFSSPSPDQVAVHDPLVMARGSIANAYLYNGDPRSLIENAIGGSGDDKLTGNQGNNVLTGNGGDDTFFYTGGIDTFVGGAKRVAGDTADFSLSDFGMVITPVATNMTTILNGHPVTVTISDTSPAADANGDAYDASVVSEAGLLHVVSMHGIENIVGSSFGDVITGNLGDNVIHAGDGNDHVFYTGGFDSLDGGNGTDTVDFSQFGSAVLAFLTPLSVLGVNEPEAYTTDTSSVFTGTALRAIADLGGFENLIGTPFADNLTGTSGNNNIDGGAGDDIISYTGGLDVLNGNTGIDTVQFNGMTSAVFVDLAGGGYEAKGNGTANANTGGLSNLADLQSIENLVGTSYNDVLRGDANANVINGGGGNDTLDGRAGDDVLNGGSGNNTLNGGPDNDTYQFAGSAHDRYFDDSGTDKIVIDSVKDITSAGRVGNDLVIKLTTGTIEIIDQFNGHPIETLVDSHGISLVLATSMTGGDLGGIIGGTDGDDVIDGRGGDDYLYGGKGNDHLLGGTGDDHLDGGQGRDVLDGGPGNDILTGGSGHDVFVFAPASPNFPGSGNDVITDFQAGKDRIDLTAFHTSFRALDDNHDGRLESGEGDGRISVHVSHGDTTLTFNGGSVRIEDVAHLTVHDFLL